MFAAGIAMSTVAIAAVAAPSSTAGQPFPRPDVFGAGIMWANWLGEHLPAKYRDNPRAYNQAQLKKLREMGAHMCHGDFPWLDIEKTRGQYDWKAADERVEDSLANCLTVYAYIGNTPDWAHPSKQIPGYRTPPDEEFAADFERYCTAVAARYAGKVDHFFFWNEPNGCSWVNDGCANGDQYALYTKWLVRAYKALKKGNPNCKIGAAVLDYNDGVKEGYKYIEGMYASGAKDHFDAIVIHPYAKEGIHWQAIDDTRRVMVAAGDADKEVWINEYGWHNAKSPEAPKRLEEFLTRISRPEYSYVTMCRYLIVTDLPDGGYGLCERDLTPRPIYDTFKQFIAKAEKTLNLPDPCNSVSASAPDPAAPPIMDLLGGNVDQATAERPLWSRTMLTGVKDKETGQFNPVVKLPETKGPGTFPSVQFKGNSWNWAGYDQLELVVNSEGNSQLSLVLYESDGKDRESYALNVPLLKEGRQTVSFKIGPGGDLRPTSPGVDNEWNPDTIKGVEIVFSDYPQGFSIEGMKLLRTADLPESSNEVK